MNEELDLLKDVAARLEKAGIEYMVTGSLVMMLYSIPRMTRDIDIIIHVSSGDAGKIVSLFRDDFYIDESKVLQAVRDRDKFTIIHNRTIIKIDFIIRKDEPYRVEEFSRKRQMNIAGIPIWVVSPEDLILSKLVWMKLSESEVQFRDVRLLLKTVRETDNEYLSQWSEKLGLDDLFRKALECD